jgi:hypothetical protein
MRKLNVEQVDRSLDEIVEHAVRHACGCITHTSVAMQDRSCWRVVGTARTGVAIRSH